MALGKGINVILDKKVDTFKSRMYCYGGYDMVTRQTLETFTRAWELKLQERSAEFQTIQGALKTYSELVETNPDNEEYQSAVKAKKQELNEAFKNLAHAEGALGMVDHLIKSVDLVETDVDIESNMLCVTGKLDFDSRGGKDKYA